MSSFDEVFTKATVFLVTTAFCFSALPSFAQQACDTTSINSSGLVERARGRCCSLSSRRRRRCVNSLRSLQRRQVEPIVGSEFRQSLSALTANFISLQCVDSPAPLPPCEVSTELTPREFQSALVSRCGDLSSTRRRALFRSTANILSSLRRSRLKSRGELARYRAANRAASNSQACEIGDAFPSFCSRFFGPDGTNNFLARPSDAFNSPVVLFPPGVNVDRCSFIEANSGRTVASGFSTGFANGGREHIRVAGQPSCTSLPNDLIVACRTGECARLSAGACGRTD